MTASWLSGFSGCLPLSQYPPAHCTGSAEEGRRGVGGRERREEVGGGSVFESEAYAV